MKKLVVLTSKNLPSGQKFRRLISAIGKDIKKNFFAIIIIFQCLSHM